MTPTTIRDGLNLLAARACAAGGVFEVALLKTSQGTVRGYFATPASVEPALKGLSANLRPEGCYITLGAVRRDLLARCTSRFEPYAKTRVADADITRRLWCPVDCDPVRPAGISATAAELQASIARCDAVVAWLVGEHHWPAPVRASGGNSGHALFAIDLPNDAPADALIKRVLDALAARFSDDAVRVDSSVHNPARIWTIYGTRKCKGDSTTDRPHRRSWIDESPDPLVCVSPEQLEAVAQLASADAGATSTRSTTDAGTVVDMRAAFEQRGWYRKDLGGGKHAVSCPWVSAHSGESGLTEACLFAPREPGGLWGFKCQHAHCADRTIKDVWALVRPPRTATSKPATGKRKAKQGREVHFNEPEPWPDAVDGAALASAIAATFLRYLALPKHASVALALWVLHCYAFSAFFTSPFLAITSPAKRCGKTLLLIVLGALVARRLFASNVTPAVLFRTIEKYSPVLLIDEADSFVRDNDELRGVLNSGHTRTTAVAIRTVGDDHEPRAFSTWCAKAIALIGKLPSTLADRSIEIPMRRRKAGEPIERLRQDRIEGVCHAIRRQAARWASDHLTELQAGDPDVPEMLNDRAADCWRPLLAIADQLGGTWPAQARSAAKALSGAVEGADEDIKVQLLADCRPYVTKSNAPSIVPTKDLLAHLHGLEDRPWNEWGRLSKPITPHTIAKLLKVYDIYPASDGTLRGYRADAFHDAFDRYLPHDPASEASDHQTPNEDGGETPISDRQSGSASDALKGEVSSMNTGVNDGLTDQSPDQGSVHEREDGDAERI